jgi:hypothetical protein
VYKLPEINLFTSAEKEGFHVKGKKKRKGKAIS